MSKKIVALGGGENGRLKSDGTYKPYETYEIDKEIVKLTNKEHPHFLFIAHSQLKEENEIGYFETMERIYGDKFGCECKYITKRELLNNKDIESKLEWADIIYEGGGDTLGMIELWCKTGFDELLYKAWQEGKVMCGVSAGANAWFSSCSSDSLKIQRNDKTAPMINVDCLNFVNLFFTPHCDEKDEYVDRLGHMKESLEKKNLVGIGLSNCCAIEIIDDKYRLIATKNDRLEPFAIKCYWDKAEYVTESLTIKEEFEPISNLLKMDNSKKYIKK